MKPAIYLVLIISFFACKNDNVENYCYLTKSNDVYEYPLKPGTHEWSILSSSEIITACQIPDSTLKIISTEGLIESVLTFPLFAEIYLSSLNTQAGFNAFYENFNGIRELLRRNDVGAKIFYRYKQMDPACGHNNWPSLLGAGSNNDFAFSFIEIIIAQYPILTQFINNDEAKIVLQEVVNKNEVKIKWNYSSVGLEHSLIIAGRIMYLCKYEPFIVEYNNNQILQDCINGAMIFDASIPDIITNYANRFLIEK